MDFNKKLNFEIKGHVFDYKLFETLNSIKNNKSQRRAASSLGISHTVLNRRILSAEEILSKKLVTVSNKGSVLTDYALDILDEYETYENRLLDDEEEITVAGGAVSCEFIRQLARIYQLENIKFLETDNKTALKLGRYGFGGHSFI